MATVQDTKRQYSLMVVEDDESAREVLCLMLAKKFPGFTIHAAENGKVGLERFRAYQPDIVITDVNMPVMDGIRMAAEIKALKADTRFIVLTAYNEKIFFQKFTQIGFSAYILKPIEFKKLFAALEKCLGEMAQAPPA